MTGDAGDARGVKWVAADNHAWSDGDDGPWSIETMCECSLIDDPLCTLRVEEAAADLVHDACGKPLWLEPVDIHAEIPVKVTIQDCGNPGGWHGMERCDHGPEVSIEHVDHGEVSP